MTPDNDRHVSMPDELCELVVLASDEALSDRQTARLEELVAGSQQTCLQYAILMHVQAGLWRRLGTDATPVVHASPFPPFSVSSPAPFVGGVLFSYTAAALIMGVGILIAWAWKLPEYWHIASHPVPLASSTPSIPSVVGRITGMADCRFAADSKTEDQRPKTAVGLGDKLTLLSGLLEITYDTGTRVILQGPVTYVVESPAGGYLSVGKLTAKVDKGSEIRDKRSDVPHPSALILYSLSILPPPW
jgi:hypothetical protein